LRRMHVVAKARLAALEAWEAAHGDCFVQRRSVVLVAAIAVG